MPGTTNNCICKSPFRLELPDRDFLQYRKTTSLYSKKTYDPNVKISNWEYYPESRPIDNDPFHPYNLHTSHYNQLGHEGKMTYTTTTQDMLEQVYSRRLDLEINPHKPLLNIFTDICEEPKNICGSAYCQDYTTTMQHSYQPPYPIELKRLSLPVIPDLLNKRMSCKDPTGKFLDDDYLACTKKLQCHKQHRAISFIPWAGHFTNEQEEST